MKFEDAKNLKAGDKIVIKLESDDARFSEQFSSENENGLVHYLFAKRQYLGKMSDSQQQEKPIVFSKQEKAEFDELMKRNDTIFRYFKTIFGFSSSDCLYQRLFGGSINRNKLNQIEFIKAIENPKLIELEKEKEYRLLIMPVTQRYLAYTDGDFNLVPKELADKFTEHRLEVLENSGSLYNIKVDECKEAVEDETN